MRLTQGSFSFLPDLTDDQISRQVEYAIENGWAVSIEYTDDPHPRNTYWEMWEAPMFDLTDAEPFNQSLASCREEVGECYIRVVAFDSTRGWESLRMSFIVNRPSTEGGFNLNRIYGPGRNVTYQTTAYATDKPAGSRY